MQRKIQIINPWIINPFFIYILFWLFTMILYFVSPSKYNYSPPLEFYFFLVLTFMIGIFFAYVFNKKLKNKEYIVNLKKTRYEKFILIILYSLEFLYSGNIPVFALLNSSLNLAEQETRNSFGIPILHVFIVTYTIYAVGRDLSKFMFLRKKALLVVPAIGLSFLMLLFSRGAIIEILLIVTFVYGSTSKIKLKRLWKIFPGVIAFMWLFGILGNIRVGCNWNDSSLIMGLCGIEGNSYSVLAPFYWVEEYIVCSLRNLIYNLQVYSVTYNFKDLAFYLLPDFISKRIGNCTVIPYVKTLTTYTAFGGAYVTFGYFGMILVYLTHILLYRVIFRFSDRHDFKFILSFSIMSIVMMLSTFDNMIHITSYFLPLIFALKLKTKIKLKIE